MKSIAFAYTVLSSTDWLIGILLSLVRHTIGHFWEVNLPFAVSVELKKIQASPATLNKESLPLKSGNHLSAKYPLPFGYQFLKSYH